VNRQLFYHTNIEFWPNPKHRIFQHNPPGNTTHGLVMQRMRDVRWDVRTAAQQMAHNSTQKQYM